MVFTPDVNMVNVFNIHYKKLGLKKGTVKSIILTQLCVNEWLQVVHFKYDFCFKKDQKENQG